MQPLRHIQIIIRNQLDAILKTNYQFRTLRSSSRNGPSPFIRNVKHSEISIPTISSEKSPPSPVPNQSAVDELEIDWNAEMKQLRLEDRRSVLEPMQNDDNFNGDLITPYAKPSHNLAAFVQKSETLQKFIELGVDLHRIERRNGLAQFIVKLDFERDVKGHLQFLNDAGVSADALGEFVSKNPLIFKEDLDNLTTRINYLQSKQFKPAQISRIVTKNPFWLMYKTQRIDARLGFFQQQFELTGPELRVLAVHQPKIITYKLDAIKQQSFSIKEEFGFSDAERKHLLLTAPKIWMMSKCNCGKFLNHCI